MARNALIRRPMDPWDTFHKFEGFLYTHVEDGVVSNRELEIILSEYVDTLRAAGDFDGTDERSFRAVLRQATHRMKGALGRLHPELAAGLRELDIQRGR